MNPSEQTEAGARTGVATWLVEAVVACLIILFGVVVLTGSWNLGSRWTSDGPGAGYFPFYIGLILCIAGAGAFYQAVLGKKKRNADIFVDSEQLRRVLQVLVPAIIYVGAIQFLGLYVASALYIALFMIVLGKYSPLKGMAVALGVITLFFFMFEVWFKVPLFKGMLNPLGFLGY